MREFFYKLLQDLDKLCGLKQYEKLMQSADRKTEINTLLDILCRVSDLFAYIPEKDQQRIISEAVIMDLEFQGLNARIVWKWLNSKKDTYFQELAHKESETEHIPLTGEAREKRLIDWQQALNALTTEKTKPVAYQKVREIEQTASGYKPDHSATEKHARHIAWIKANYNPMTQKPKTIDEGWISEEDFNSNLN